MRTLFVKLSALILVGMVIVLAGCGREPAPTPGQALEAAKAAQEVLVLLDNLHKEVVGVEAEIYQLRQQLEVREGKMRGQRNMFVLLFLILLAVELWRGREMVQKWIVVPIMGALLWAGDKLKKKPKKAEDKPPAEAMVAEGHDPGDPPGSA